MGPATAPLREPGLRSSVVDLSYLVPLRPTLFKGSSMRTQSPPTPAPTPVFATAARWASVALLSIGLDRVAAFEVSVPPVTVANPGGYAQPLQLDADRYRQQQQQKQQQRAENTRRTSAQSTSLHLASSSPTSKACSADALPAADRKRMEAEYMRRLKSSGKASADAYAQRQGRLYRQKLEAEGVCPSTQKTQRTAQSNKSTGAPQRASGNAAKSGTGDRSGCRMEMRPIANVGGGAMSMGMVPVCD